MKAITHNIDLSVWRDLMLKSGMLALMDAQARDEWYKNLHEGDLPEISEENILATFEHLHHSKGEVFERGVVNVFFQKGSAHITFKRPDLVERMNDIIAKHYPGMLAQ